MSLPQLCWWDIVRLNSDTLLATCTQGKFFHQVHENVLAMVTLGTELPLWPHIHVAFIRVRRSQGHHFNGSNAFPNPACSHTLGYLVSDSARH